MFPFFPSNGEKGARPGSSRDEDDSLLVLSGSDELKGRSDFSKVYGTKVKQKDSDDEEEEEDNIYAESQKRLNKLLGRKCMRYQPKHCLIPHQSSTPSLSSSPPQPHKDYFENFRLPSSLMTTSPSINPKVIDIPDAESLPVQKAWTKSPSQNFVRRIQFGSVDRWFNYPPNCNYNKDDGICEADCLLIELECPSSIHRQLIFRRQILNSPHGFIERHFKLLATNLKQVNYFMKDNDSSPLGKSIDIYGTDRRGKDDHNQTVIALSYFDLLIESQGVTPDIVHLFASLGGGGGHHKDEDRNSDDLSNLREKRWLRLYFDRGVDAFVLSMCMMRMTANCQEDAKYVDYIDRNNQSRQNTSSRYSHWMTAISSSITSSSSISSTNISTKSISPKVDSVITIQDEEESQKDTNKGFKTTTSDNDTQNGVSLSIYNPFRDRQINLPRRTKHIVPPTNQVNEKEFNEMDHNGNNAWQSNTNANGIRWSVKPSNTSHINNPIADVRRVSSRSNMSPHSTINRLTSLYSAPPEDELKIISPGQSSSKDSSSYITTDGNNSVVGEDSRIVYEPPPIKNPRQLFIYPEDDVDRAAVPVTTAEVQRLQGSYYLNDRLIDFDLQHALYNNSNVEGKVKRSIANNNNILRRVHIFSCLFYATLKSKMVQRASVFTQHVDIFSKDFLIVPINEHLHWFVAVICYPRRLLEANDTEEEEEEEMGEQQRQHSNDEWLSIDGVEFVPDDLESERTRIKVDDDRRRKTAKNVIIALLDSLGPRPKSHVLHRLKEFLIFEAISKKGLKEDHCNDINKNDDNANVDVEDDLRCKITGMYVRVPLQLNVVDCGLHLTMNVRKMLANLDEFFVRGICENALSQWYPSEEASQRRTRLLQLISEIAEQYQLKHPDMMRMHEDEGKGYKNNDNEDEGDQDKEGTSLSHNINSDDLQEITSF